MNSRRGVRARIILPLATKSTAEISHRQRRTVRRAANGQATVTFIFARRHTLAASRNAVDARAARFRSPVSSCVIKIARSNFRRAYATPAITQRRNFPPPPPLITPAHRPASRNRARCYATCATTRRQRSRIRGAIDLAARRGAARRGARVDAASARVKLLFRRISTSPAGWNSPPLPLPLSPLPL